MSIKNLHLQDFRGRVDSIVPNKACILFTRAGKEERALVMYDRVKFSGNSLPDNGKFDDYIKEGMVVSFSAHQIYETGHDRCGWFVTQIMADEVNRKLFPYLYCNDLATHGVFNKCGTVVYLANRQGVLTFKSDNGRQENVFFLASKLFIRSTRFKSNLKGSTQVEEGTEMYFDAVPCHNQENEFECQWFATVISNNPRAMFICGEGHVLAIINAEYGIALGSIKPNIWQSILFHRSMCFLFQLNLSTKDLREVFKKGDKINFIAVPSPKKFIAQMIATQISIYTDPRLGPQL
ncbi:hypothetical protein LSTR_LSTR009325 [Laodelphax striatellus]|uniref:Uncharacterized protein n=1 Tax=Laodelphax striatellus TaxID=195883 RepID=A0A482XIF6_LAOST|nr:hypothetical protein LSTR_LSTR009325 [Laodelphax striatellus]